MKHLKEELNILINSFKEDYPYINFTVSQDQTSLLDYSINNLKKNLLIGALLAMFIMFLFLKDLKSPLLIGITVPLSIVISLLFFHILTNI